MTAVEWLIRDLISKGLLTLSGDTLKSIGNAKEMEKQEKIELLKSLVYSVCIGDDVEDVEEWLKEHELNKSE